MTGSATLPLLERGGYVVLERAGGLWGVAGREVHRLDRHGEGLRLELEGGALEAETVLAVVPDLTVRPAPAVVARYWPEAAAGLAVYDERPVLVIDAGRPPGVLRAAQEDQEGEDSGQDVQSQGTGGHGDAGAGD